VVDDLLEDRGIVASMLDLAGAGVFEVTGGPFGTFELPAVRAFIRVFAPRRGEIVVDADALDLRAPRDRGPAAERPRAPRRRTSKAKAAQAKRET